MRGDPRAGSGRWRRREARLSASARLGQPCRAVEAGCARDAADAALEKLGPRGAAYGRRPCASARFQVLGAAALMAPER